MSQYCCQQFAEKVEETSGEFERDDAGDWNIGGCCGGGCYVVTKMKFCPFCGAALHPHPPSKTRHATS